MCLHGGFIGIKHKIWTERTCTGHNVPESTTHVHCTGLSTGGRWYKVLLSVLTSVLNSLNTWHLFFFNSLPTWAAFYFEIWLVALQHRTGRGRCSIKTISDRFRGGEGNFCTYIHTLYTANISKQHSCKWRVKAGREHTARLNLKKWERALVTGCISWL